MTVTDLTPEERVRRVKAALAEAGYPDAPVIWGPHDYLADRPCVKIAMAIPAAVRWRVRAVADEILSCWDCWSKRDGSDGSCDHDPLTSPWPEVVR